ncbi:MAG: FHA domain-containing protein [Chloracidobacterium sp.]|uniref:FHA domain-containing protein n=1 Tax=Chloracidobacterium validum TaxID=2821543 RepID=A0ABX8B728_9BACT|nr:FHA domain-containing protein [Chloracidobacterium validum]QUW02446.1 FHA domain-containing protein [Chloracidobacterium validum]
MNNDTRRSLLELERFLTEAIRSNPILTPDDVKPNLLVRQILDQLSLKRFIWVGNQTFVPHRMVFSVPSMRPAKLEELEVLFNSIVFTKMVYDYIAGSGFRLLEPLAIEIRPTLEGAGVPSHCSVSFEWSSLAEPTEGFSVTVDEQSGRIVDVKGFKPQIPRLARLTALNGEVYRSPFIITKRTTFLGRLRTVLDLKSGEVLRRNDFVYARQDQANTPNKSVSRQHASIVFDNGDFYLFDTGSANGTAVERAGQSIETPASDATGIKLEDGDIIRLGTALVRFELDPPPAELPDLAAAEANAPADDLNPTSGNATVRILRSEILFETSKVLDSE